MKFFECKLNKRGNRIVKHPVRQSFCNTICTTVAIYRKHSAHLSPVYLKPTALPVMLKHALLDFPPFFVLKIRKQNLNSLWFTIMTSLLRFFSFNFFFFYFVVFCVCEKINKQTYSPVFNVFLVSFSCEKWQLIFMKSFSEDLKRK